ncbi:putative inactive receptor kinase [Prunus yedoensis var. nudiflora]|uniref:Putative inactive receptor kinase n=1 Tax=Prunus yedoensis var. nudiflora TaxID=2094558 RepID=A0A314ZF22_PRUYE|nr:putative inactive receptor kinase [Prunus yedoensis var. nudiflora]
MHSQSQRLSLFLFSLLVLLPIAKPDLGSDRAALLALRSAVGGRTLLWNVNQPTPCSWAGVNCENNRVTVLRLPGVALSGTIPNLSACVTLRNLYLQGNLFSGEIPQFLYSLHDLVRLNLASNNFSGEISLGFNNLTRIRTLYLQNNKLSGVIPELNLPKLEQFNTYSSSSFLGNLLCGRPLDSACPGESGAAPNGDININDDHKKKSKLSGAAIAGIVIGSKSSKKTSSVDIATVKHPEVEIPGDKLPADAENGGYGNGYSVAAAAAAAMVGNGKSEAIAPAVLPVPKTEVLGKGTFGTAYKAVLEVGTVVAVKRLKDVTISESEFKEKIEAVGVKDHENLVPLRAYYFSRDEKLLVYDYMPMGSLSALLHGNKGAGRTPLNWEIRSGIALGAARGIEYLHSQGQTVSHGNIKSSNILLTKSYEARVSDFGLAHLVGPSSTPNRVAGYRAPEVTDPRKVSQKADVYSFGVLLLELLTGKPPTHALLNEEGVDLPRWVQSIVKEEWTSEVFDLELLRYQNVEEEMVQLLQLAIDCSAQYPDKRPSISEVTRRIEELRRSSLREDHEQQHHPDVVHDLEDVSSR